MRDKSFKMKNLAVVIMIAVSTLAFTQQQPRCQLRQRGLPSGMRRSEWGCVCPQASRDQIVFSLLR
jgi:hypothetical protein